MFCRSFSIKILKLNFSIKHHEWITQAGIYRICSGDEPVGAEVPGHVAVRRRRRPVQGVRLQGRQEPERDHRREWHHHHRFESRPGSSMQWMLRRSLRWRRTNRLLYLSFRSWLVYTHAWSNWCLVWCNDLSPKWSSPSGRYHAGKNYASRRKFPNGSES